jgi:hypothetical protein
VVGKLLQHCVIRCPIREEVDVERPGDGYTGDDDMVIGQANICWLGRHNRCRWLVIDALAGGLASGGKVWAEWIMVSPVRGKVFDRKLHIRKGDDFGFLVLIWKSFEEVK